MPQKFTEEMYASIPALVEAGLSTRQIAEKFNSTPASLKVLCSRRGISLRRGGKFKPIPKVCKILNLSPYHRQPLEAKARDLGMDELALVKKLIRTIVRDDLYSAVLDLGPGTSMQQ